MAFCRCVWSKFDSESPLVWSFKIEKCIYLKYIRKCKPFWGKKLASSIDFKICYQFQCDYFMKYVCSTLFFVFKEGFNLTLNPIYTSFFTQKTTKNIDKYYF